MTSKHLRKPSSIVSFILLCFTDIVTTVTISELTSETSVTQISMSTPESPKLGTKASLTDNDFNISQSTTLGHEVLSTDENSNISQRTTITTGRNLNVKTSKHLYNSVQIGSIWK